MTSAPVVLVIHRRPVHTARVFARVREIKPARLLVVADGGDPDDEEMQRDIAAARALTEDVDWPCRVTRDYAAEQLRCDRRIVTGLDAVFAEFDEAIVLEDDCLPDPSFFSFAQELLDRYRHDERVMSIGGHLSSRPDECSIHSYAFTSYPTSWGWATWRRSWERYAPTLEFLASPDAGSWIQARCGSTPFASTYWQRALSRPEGTRDWTHAWTAAHWLADGYAIRPRLNLVRNIGFDTTATHTAFPEHPIATRSECRMPQPLTHPDDVALDVDWDREIEDWEHSGVLQRQIQIARARVDFPTLG